MKKSLIMILTIVLLGQGQTSAVAQTSPATGPEQAPVKVDWEELDGFFGTTPDLFHKAAREGDLVLVQHCLPPPGSVR